MNTVFGSVLSLIITVVVLIYATAKSSHLQSVSGQTISVYDENHDHDHKNPLLLNDIGFRFAVSFESVVGKKAKNDPRFLRWIVSIFTEGDKHEERLVKFHECT
mgnify:CR=1 FL=1